MLILSRFAGAARQMKDALIVNPYSREELADAIGAAIAMPRSERVRRWESLMAGVVRDDVGAWRDSFLAALQAARQAPDAERPRRVGSPFVAEFSEERVAVGLGRDSATSAAGWRTRAQG